MNVFQCTRAFGEMHIGNTKKCERFWSHVGSEGNDTTEKNACWLALHGKLTHRFAGVMQENIAGLGLESCVGAHLSSTKTQGCNKEQRGTMLGMSPFVAATRSLCLVLGVLGFLSIQQAMRRKITWIERFIKYSPCACYLACLANRQGSHPFFA